MKLIKLLALTVLIPSLVFADNIAVVNSSQATLYGSQGIGGPVSMDTKGNLYVNVIDGGSGLTQSVIPVSSNPLNGAVTDGIKAGSVITDDTIEAASTRTVLNLTANVAAIGDYIIPTGGTAANLGKWYQVCDKATNTVTLCGTGLDATPSTDAIRIFRYRPLSATGTAADGSAVGLLVSLNRFYQNGNSGDLLKAEDAAHTTGDAGVMGLGVNNRNFTALNSTNADYTPLSTGDEGQIYATLVGNTATQGISAIRSEDQAFGASEALAVVGGQAVSAIAQTVGTSGDVAPPSMDLGNRLVTTNAPAGETASGCTSAITTNTTGTIVTNLASNRFYMTSVTCTNTGGAATRVRIQDGASNPFADLMLAATTGYAFASFPTPARTNSNSSLVANVITTGSSTICCANGYYSTI